MSADAAPKPAPFNPGWISALYAVAAGVISGIVAVCVYMAVSAQRDAEMRSRQDALESRVSVIEKRFSEEQLATGKTLVALQKDVETANKALASIQAALMVRPATVSPNTP